MWQGIEGHDEIVDRFRRMLARSRMACTFLFVGPAGIGKCSFALQLAKALLCHTNPEAELNACGRCDSCVQIDAGTHPDLTRISKPADKSEIPLSMFIGEKDGRMQSGLCHDISLKPFMGGRKVAIIDDADALNEEGANALLKTLEEPPPKSVLILIATSADKQLPTIRSRAQLVRFTPLAEETVARLLQTDLGITDPAEARRLATFSEGSLERALDLSDPALEDFRKQFLGVLAKNPFDSVGFAKPMLAFIDAAGKDAGPRRKRSKLVIGIAAEFYRQLARGKSGLAIAGDECLQRALNQALHGESLPLERVAERAEKCLNAIEYVDRNANQATLIEAWLDELRV